MQLIRPVRSKRRLGLRTIAILIVSTVAVGLPAGALAGGFTARLYPSSHTPKVGAWPLKVTATRGGLKLSGSVSYRFLFQGQVVSSQPGGSFSHGVYRDTLNWPKAAIGHTVTLQVVVRTRYGTNYLDWWIKVYPR
jgi:hypothetical protein